MFITPLRTRGSWKHFVVSINTNNIVPVVTAFGHRTYAKGGDKGEKCCNKTFDQTKGKKVVDWPKEEPVSQPWLCTCPRDPQPPPCFDPYRIKVPDVVVPPLPPSNAKEPSEEDTNGPCYTPGLNGPKWSPSRIHDLFHNSPIVHPDYWREAPPKRLADAVRESLPKLSYHGKTKYKYAFHEPWKPLDRISLLDQAEREENGNDSDFNTKPEIPQLNCATDPMLDCAKIKGACSPRPPYDPPPCPPPPPPPFPWKYVWITAGFFTIMGLIYQVYLLRTRSSENKIVWRPRRKVKRPYTEKDLPACVQYLIVGAGTAGWAAYRAIAANDKKAKVFFISKEDNIPYDRPPMSKQMWWNPEPPDMKTLSYLEDMRKLSMYVARCKDFMDPVKFYRKKVGPALSMASGWCVLRIDPEEHVAYVQTVCGEQPVYYERILLALGSKAKNLRLTKGAPKFVRDRVQVLRSIRDLEKAYRRVRESRHVVIVGGGLLGTELAWHLGKMNALIERADDAKPIEFVHMYKDRGILGNLLPDYLGEWAAEYIKCTKVQVMPNTMVYDAFETEDGRLQLTLSNGKSLVTDYVLVAIGTVPRDEIAEESFLEVDSVNGGFKVNTELVARKHVFVAGDAASLYSQWKDTRIRMEHYINAQEQGTVAGMNMTGLWETFNKEPYFQLNLGKELNVEVIGEIGACMPTVALFKQCNEEAQALLQEKLSDPETIRKRREAKEKLDRENEIRKKKGLPPIEIIEDCYTKPTEEESEEFKYRYKRGMVFYLRDDVVVGIMFWNLSPIEDRKEVVTEMLRARPSYKDINMLAELLGFPESDCMSEYMTVEERNRAKIEAVPESCIDPARRKYS